MSKTSEPTTPSRLSTPLTWAQKNLILVTGKGGVGKSTLTRAIAQKLARSGKKTLLCTVLQISEHPQKLEKTETNLDEIQLHSTDCFNEYILLKLKIKALYSAFIGNKVTQYLEKAAPGVREMVLLGKLWFERNHYDHVVVDMPSTGYTLAMLHTPFNFVSLFPGGPIYQDAKEMIATFSDPAQTDLIIVSLAEEMPIQESLELKQNLKELFPKNEPHFIINRLLAFTDEKAIEAQKKYQSDTQTNHLLSYRALNYLIEKEKHQRKQIEQLSQIPIHIIEESRDGKIKL